MNVTPQQPPKPLVIGITGAAGAGKDTVAAILKRHAAFRALAFADALRTEVCAAYGIEPIYLTRRVFKDSPQAYLALGRCADTGFVQTVLQLHGVAKREAADFLKQEQSPRQIMQWWGTEYRRNQAGPSYWLDQVRDTITVVNQVHEARNFVVTDVRFANEANFIRGLGGGIWQVARPGAQATGQHASDVSGAEFAPDRVVDNSGTLDDLVISTVEAYLAAERLYLRGVLHAA